MGKHSHEIGPGCSDLHLKQEDIFGVHSVRVSHSRYPRCARCSNVPLATISFQLKNTLQVRLKKPTNQLVLLGDLKLHTLVSGVKQLPGIVQYMIKPTFVLVSQKSDLATSYMQGQ